MTQRTPTEAQDALDAATELARKDGGTVHPDALVDAAEMALDGQSIESMADRIKKERAEPYEAEGGWSLTVGRN